MSETVSSWKFKGEDRRILERLKAQTMRSYNYIMRVAIRTVTVDDLMRPLSELADEPEEDKEVIV